MQWSFTCCSGSFIRVRAGEKAKASEGLSGMCKECFAVLQAEGAHFL